MVKQTITYYLLGRSAIAPAITAARYQAVKRAGGRCELTGEGGDLDGHHLWDVSTFPWFAAKSWNIIMIKPSLHKEFHAWRGGTHKWCTPFHFWWWWWIAKHPIRTLAFAALFIIATWEFYKWL